jgi:hypothetical protein
MEEISLNDIMRAIMRLENNIQGIQNQQVILQNEVNNIRDDVERQSTTTNLSETRRMTNMNDMDDLNDDLLLTNLQNAYHVSGMQINIETPHVKNEGRTQNEKEKEKPVEPDNFLLNLMKEREKELATFSKPKEVVKDIVNEKVRYNNLSSHVLIIS